MFKASRKGFQHRIDPKQQNPRDTAPLISKNPSRAMKSFAIFGCGISRTKNVLRMDQTDLACFQELLDNYERKSPERNACF